MQKCKPIRYIKSSFFFFINKQQLNKTERIVMYLLPISIQMAAFVAQQRAELCRSWKLFPIQLSALFSN